MNNNKKKSIGVGLGKSINVIIRKININIKNKIKAIKTVHPLPRFFGYRLKKNVSRKLCL